MNARFFPEPEASAMDPKDRTPETRRMGDAGEEELLARIDALAERYKNVMDVLDGVKEQAAAAREACDLLRMELAGVKRSRETEAEKLAIFRYKADLSAQELVESEKLKNEVWRLRERRRQDAQRISGLERLLEAAGRAPDGLA